MARISKAITNRPPTGKKKKCSCCNEIKDETEFYRIKKDSKRRISYCKKCSKLKSKAYRDKLKNNEKYSNITKSSF